MAMYSTFDVQIEYSGTDQYIRAIRFNMIRANGNIKISAFKSNKGGVSVTRSNECFLEDALTYMKSNFEGRMAVFARTVCDNAEIFEKHSPSLGHNTHHWELYGNAQYDELSLSQIVEIIKECRLR